MSEIKVRQATAAEARRLADFNRALALESEGLALNEQTVMSGVVALMSHPERGFYLVAEKDGVPAGCLLDADGAPTTDPQAMYPATGDGMGALQTFGGPVAGHKGYALAFMCELLGAAVAGGQIIRPATLQRNAGVWNNMLAIVFDPARRGSSATLGHEVQAFIDWVRAPADHERQQKAAIAAKQQWMADLAREGIFAEVPKDARWQDYADRVLGRLPADDAAR